MINTKFGNARINNDGYYIISSKKEGNNGKLLHRLIWESIWGKLPEGWIVHHLDGNKTNNCILNLYGMSRKYHNKLHFTGENNPNYGITLSEERKEQIRRYNLGRDIPEETRLKISKNKNSNGLYRVIKHKDKRYSQGFRWRYVYTLNGKTKTLSSVDLEKLKEKVLSKGLHWEKFTEVA